MLSLTVAQAGRRLWPLCVRPYCQSVRLAATTAVNRPTDRSQMTGYQRTKTELMNQFEAFLSHRQLKDVAGRYHPMLFNMMKLCGSGLIETPQTKVELAQHMWKAMKDSGLKSKVPLYNLLLQVYVLNEYHFSPSKVIEEMKACDVSPNQGTLALILRGYCQQGKLDGATQVLQYMKALNHPINEHSYAALITGHSRAGDMAGLQQIIVAMEAKGLCPGAITFFAVLCAYAERGDMGAILDVFDDLRQRQVFLNQAEIIKIMDTLSAHGHGHLIPRVMDFVRNKQWMQSALQDLACLCAVRGEFDSTMTILGCLNDPGSFSFSAVADAVLRSEGKTMEEKMAMLGRLEESCYGASQHDAVMNYLLQQQKMKDAVAMVKDLHSKGLPVRMHYMYPVLAWYTREKDLKGFLKTIQLIGDVGLDVRDEQMSAVTSYGLWNQIRVDHGREFYLILYIQECLRRCHGPPSIAPYVQSPSKENLTVERVWVEVNSRVNYPLKRILI